MTVAFFLDLSKEDFNINLEKDTLILSSEKENTSDETMNYTRKEFSFGKFKRSFIIPKTVDVEGIVADYNAGILKVTLPKKEDAKVDLSRQISVN